MPSLKTNKFWLVNECIEEYRSKKKKGWVVKLDLEKAYDRTDWGFLDFVMVKKGSGSKWRRWVYGCLSSTRFFGSNQWLSQRIPCGNQGVKTGRFLIPISLYTILRLLT